jgi:hypothetical protein
VTRRVAAASNKQVSRVEKYDGAVAEQTDNWRMDVDILLKNSLK